MDACSGASVASRHCEYPDLGSGPERGSRRGGSEGWTVKAVDMEPSQAHPGLVGPFLSTASDFPTFNARKLACEPTSMPTHLSASHSEPP